MRRTLLGFGLVAALCALAPVPAALARQFRPRVGFAMGVLPRYGTDVAAGIPIPVAYHGGSVMRDVTVHTVFWAPPGYAFDGPPGAGVLGYRALIEQFLTDSAHDSGAASNAFSVLGQFGDGAGAGGYQIHYDPLVDSITDTDPYPAHAHQCPSPAGIATCVTDASIARELDHLIGAGAGLRGMSNIWFVFLPPDVDTCTAIAQCGSDAYAGYHSLFDLAHGPTVYSPVPDPLIEFTPPPGSDPQGNPEAESAIDTVAHEAVEAITDPEGNAWMDPNGFEVGDKCEFGPQQGTPLGYAADGSPYDQLINGHQYLVQDMWSNAVTGCVQRSTAAGGAPPLNTVDLRQFSSSVSGRLGVAQSIEVAVGLIRAHKLVALARTVSRADGRWGPVTLRGQDGSAHAVGDDRDVLAVAYNGATPGAIPADVIRTGSGGDPFTESGFTGWFDLDNGFAVHTRSGRSTVTLGPCAQTGVLTVAIGATLAPSPTDLCQTETDAAVLGVPRIGAGSTVTLTSEDNRGVYVTRPDGTLVRMTVAVGEPNSVSARPAASIGFTPTGFPTCTAFLRIGAVRCAGLVPRARYSLLRSGHRLRAGRAASRGALTLGGLPVHGGDVLTLVNSSGRRLTALHVARLRVGLVGAQTRIASGTCQPGEYWGAPLASAPNSVAVGVGVSDTGTICPAGGLARGLPAGVIAQTDEFSGGETVTQVPLIESTSPIQDETLYGAFVASAQSGLPGPSGSVVSVHSPVSLTLAWAASRHKVMFFRNVDTAAGVSVPALRPGAYLATWVLRDRVGDTRTLTTRFVDEP